MASKIYLNSTSDKDRTSQDVDLVSAVKNIIIDKHAFKDESKLELVDAEEWKTIISQLQPHIDAETGIRVNLGRISMIASYNEILTAYAIAKEHYQAIQEKHESTRHSSHQLALPDTATTLGDMVRKDFPSDTHVQSTVFAHLREQITSQVNHEANMQANV